MADTPPMRSSRRVRIVLALSLAFNLLVIGVVVGATWRHGGPRGPLPGLQAYATPYVHALPRQDRRALLREVRRQTPRLTRKARREAYAEMLAALRADPFEAAAAEALLTRQSRTLAAVQETAQERWLSIIAAMSAAERAAYADLLEEVLQRNPPRRRHAR